MGYGTHEGGLKAAKKIMAVDPDHFKRIGQIGGKGGTKETRSKRGFGSNREAARAAGRLGGSISSRGDYKLTTQEQIEIRQRIRDDMELERNNDVTIQT